MKIHFLSGWVLAVLLWAAVSTPAFAHCDTLDGPVVQDARAALEKKDVTPVLKWVMPDAEPEVRAAFEAAVAEKAKDPAQAEAADRAFFETLIRVHRAGEGAPYTGLKPAGSVEPTVVEADKAIDSGSVDGLIAALQGHLAEGIKERFNRVHSARSYKDESVEAGRAYVEAYVDYVHYVESVNMAVVGKSGHHTETEGLRAEAGEAASEGHGMHH